MSDYTDIKINGCTCHCDDTCYVHNTVKESQMTKTDRLLVEAGAKWVNDQNARADYLRLMTDYYLESPKADLSKWVKAWDEPCPTTGKSRYEALVIGEAKAHGKEWITSRIAKETFLGDYLEDRTWVKRSQRLMDILKLIAKRKGDIKILQNGYLWMESKF